MLRDFAYFFLLAGIAIAMPHHHRRHRKHHPTNPVVGSSNFTVGGSNLPFVTNSSIESPASGGTTNPSGSGAQITFSVDDVIQGHYGDCWFEGTLGALAMPGEKSILKQIVQQTPQGFSVTLAGQSPVTVTDGECQESRGDSNPCTWAVAIETVAHKLAPNEIENGSDPSKAVNILLGQETQFFGVPFNYQNIPPLYPASANVAAAGCGNCNVADLVPDHVYTLEKVENGKYSVRNPWGFSPNNEPALITMDEAEFNNCFNGVWVFNGESQ